MNQPDPHATPDRAAKFCEWCGRVLHYPPDEPSRRCPECEREEDAFTALGLHDA